MITPPKSLDELMQRAHYLSGYPIKDIAEAFHINVPKNLTRHKGWVGNFIEHLLGADAGSKATQDFSALNIELKTIPVNKNNTPLETTFVCLAPLTGNTGVTWESSHVKEKLSRVLWIPVEGERNIPLKDRIIGHPILWQPSLEETQILKNDWEELTEMITLGQFKHINAKLGEALQLRPKGASSHSRTLAYDQKGQLIETLPLGFYLRTHFTANILKGDK